MTKSMKKYYLYGICFKEKVVSEVSSGSGISEVCRRYGITDTSY
jgi:transposase-like protein